MPKAIKWSLGLILGLPLLLTLLLLIVFSIYDANDFKPTLVEEANKAGLNLAIEDDLTWSLMPLGIEIEKLKINDQENKPFADANTILAQVDLFSIFGGQPQIKQLSIDGLNLNLIQYAADSANWSNLISENVNTDSSSQTPDTNDDQSSESKSSQTEETSTKTLDFLIGKIAITNTSINYRSIPNDSDLSLSPIDIVITDIQPNAKVPLEISFDFSDNTGNKVSSRTNSFIKFSPDFKSISLIDFDSRNQIQTTALPNKALDISLKTQLLLDLIKQKLALNELALKVNDSAWTGDVNVGLDNQAITAKLSGDKINLDDFLPPAQESGTDKQPQTASETTTVDTKDAKDAEDAEDDSNKPLLPLDTLRGLLFDIHFTQQQIIAKGLSVENTDVKLTAKNGLISLQELSGQTYEGAFNVKGQINAKTDNPTFALEKTLNGLNLEKLFDALTIQEKEQMGRVSGLLNLQADLNAQGNTVTTISEAANANFEFQIGEGSVTGINLKAYACEGFAKINRDSVDTDSWPDATPFDAITGDATYKNQLANIDFKLVTSGLTVESDGNFDSKTMQIDIGAGLRVTGDLGENACRVNDKVKGIVIPVRCKGEATAPPKEICGLDTKRLLRSAEDLAKSEAKRKVDKEINRALKKHLGDDGENNELKDAAKKLLNKWF